MSRTHARRFRAAELGEKQVARTQDKQETESSCFVASSTRGAVKHIISTAVLCAHGAIWRCVCGTNSTFDRVPHVGQMIYR